MLGTVKPQRAGVLVSVRYLETKTSKTSSTREQFKKVCGRGMPFKCQQLEKASWRRWHETRVRIWVVRGKQEEEAKAKACRWAGPGWSTVARESMVRRDRSCAYRLAEGVSASPCVMLPNQAVTPVTTLAHSSAGTCFSPF